MKATIKNLKLTMPIVGNAGPMNGSTLKLNTSLGEVTPSPFGWDLTGLEKLKVSGGSLKIPSGELVFHIDYFDMISESSISYQGQGIWKGQTAGLTGGMSGFGRFEANFKTTEVFHGTFLCPIQKPLGIGIQPISLEQYCSRRSKIAAVEQYYFGRGPHLRQRAFTSDTSETFALKCKWVASRTTTSPFFYEPFYGLIEEGPPEDEESFIFWWWDLIMAIDGLSTDDIRSFLFPPLTKVKRERKNPKEEILEVPLEEEEYDLEEYDDD